MSTGADGVGPDVEGKGDTELGGKRKLTGQLKLKGDAFDGYQPDEVVTITGQVVFTSPVVATPKCRLSVTGQMVAPEGSERMLVPAIQNMMGQLLYYPDGVKPRILLSKETFRQAFFETMTEKECLINLGQVRFAPDVQGQSLTDKIHSIINLGRIECSKLLLPFVQVLCRDNLGKIEAE